MIIKRLVCGLVKGHDYVGMGCKRCGCGWEWAPERTADEVEAEILAELERMAS